ncbi:UDP-N-acetylglucosamine transferase subunit ALG14-like [Clytia hemisphaerica]|uniref:UDP-N-acetylglucosamine transferase subunit ALG14 n=1 Tax=Clytia hemisphaerica TaxID=252671 RepID=A0A7M5X2V7_9CNID
MVLLIFLALLLLMRALYLVFGKKSSKNKDFVKCKTMAIFGSGGHTSEMMTLLQSLNDTYSPRVYVYAHTDHGSLKKIKTMELNRTTNYEVELESIPRSREVKQSWLTTVFTTLNASFHAFYIVWKHKPDLLLCNGPGTCIPLCGAVFVFKVIFFMNTKMLFVESICRVKSLSLTGQILYFMADTMLVQWKELQERYPRTQYIGTLM